jgi:predicted nucleotidyltransferase
MVRKPSKSPESKSDQPKPAKMHIWDVCLVADKLRWLGRIEAENEANAIAESAKQFNKDPEKLIVVKRGDLR